MGLTIKFGLSIPRNDAREARRLVEALRQEVLGLPFQSVSDLGHFVSHRADHRKSTAEPWRSFLIQAQGFLWDPLDPHTAYSVPPLEVYGFRTWPGEGCEEANFGLCLYPEAVRRPDGGDFPSGLGGWSWRSFCKTQYANDPRCGGIANFLRCHLLVVALLDAAVRLGFAVEVDDEGEYWGKRDVAALARTVGDWDRFVAALGGALKDSAEREGISFIAPILGRPDFESLEAAGSRDPQVAKVLDLVRRTARRPSATDKSGS
jgi:hypothetical protein